MSCEAYKQVRGDVGAEREKYQKGSRPQTGRQGHIRTLTYVGKSDGDKSSIHRRIVRATQSETRSPLWDHFSWYVREQPKLIHDTEVLLLRMLPPYLRSLTRQSGYFLGTSKHGEPQEKRDAVFISRRAPGKKHS